MSINNWLRQKVRDWLYPSEETRAGAIKMIRQLQQKYQTLDEYRDAQTKDRLERKYLS